ncbi:MAG: homocysteine S-methyltransferase family protein [Rhizobiaceae bacterium]
MVLLDGGMGQELIARSVNPAHPLWSAKVMMDEPEIVCEIHQDYLRAGATVLTLNTYSATPERLARDGFADSFKTLQKRAIELAKQAIEQTRADAAIAGCLSPLFASYRPDVAPPYPEMLDLYRQIVAEQAESVDLFLCETLASVAEIRAATTAAVESGKSVWVAMTLNDGTAAPELRSGEPFADGISAAVENGAAAVLGNCSWPESISAGFDDLSASQIFWGAYANGFTSINPMQPGGTVDELAARDDLNPESYCDWAMTAIEHGASIIGGCCEVGPAHIAAIASRFQANGYQVTKDLHA